MRYFLGSVVISLLTICVLMLWSTKGCQQLRSHIKSGTIGLQRVVTFYAVDGTKLAEWSGRLNVEDKGGSFRFVTENGKAITVTGSVVVEER